MRSNYLVSCGVYSETYCPGGGARTYSFNSGSQGAFVCDMSTSLANIVDGLSNTFLAGESLQGPGHWDGTADGGQGYVGPYWGAGSTPRRTA